MNEPQTNTEIDTAVQEPKKTQNVFKNKNFILLFLGTLVTNVGAMFYSFAISFYILDLTGNNALIQGIYLAFCGIIYVLMSPFGGVLADRWKKAKIIFMSDYIRGAFIGLSAVATFFIMKAGNVTLQVILLFAIGFVSNIISAIFDPAAASLLPLIVESDRIQQANSYFQILRNLQSVLGILLAGILYSLVPIHILFTIIAACYLVSGFSEMFIRHEYTPPVEKTTLKTMVADFKDGIKYLKTQKAIVSMLFLLLFINFFFAPFYSNGMPYFIKLYVANQNYLFKDFLQPEMWSSIFSTAFSIGSIVMGAILSVKAMSKKCGRSLKIGTILIAVVLIVVVALFYILVERGVNFNLYLILLAVGMLVIGVIVSFIDVPILSVMMVKIDRQYQAKVFSLLSIGSQGLIPIALFLGGLILNNLGLGALYLFCALGFVIIMIITAANKSIEEF